MLRAASEPSRPTLLFELHGKARTTDRAERAPAPVLAEIESMDVLYGTGETFPYWPAWLEPQG